MLIRSEKFKYSVSGFVSGIVNGVFGSGGGMLLIPLLTGYCGEEERRAFADSICVMLPISVITLFTLGLQQPLPITDALPYCVGGILGGVLGGLTFQKIPVSWLHKLLGLMILWGGIRTVMK